jgi:hypothetical protein
MHDLTQVHDAHVQAKQNENYYGSEDVPRPQFRFAHDFLLSHYDGVKIRPADDHEN